MVVLFPIIFLLMGWANLFGEIQESKGVFFSTEEDFITRGPKPVDGNPIISDGDLLHSSGYVYMRNHKLLDKCCKVHYDLGLDAADVIDVKRKIVAFSTELDDPHGSFTAGDLVFTNGASLPNFVLLTRFKIPRHLDPGLDAVQFIGKKDTIIKFIDAVRVKGKRYWIEKPARLIEYLEKYGIDIWFSTEGTAPTPNAHAFLDGDLLSAATGTIIAANSQLLPPTVPAGIFKRGVDFGLDAVTCSRRGNKELLDFSTEILYKGKPMFTDGDVLRFGSGVIITNDDLIQSFEPKAKFLGLDALSHGR